MGPGIEPVFQVRSIAGVHCGEEGGFREAVDFQERKTRHLGGRVAVVGEPVRTGQSA